MGFLKHLLKVSLAVSSSVQPEPLPIWNPDLFLKIYHANLGCQLSQLEVRSLVTTFIEKMKVSVFIFCSVALLSLQAVSAFAASSVSIQPANGLKKSRSSPLSIRNARHNINGHALMMSIPRGGAIAANGIFSSIKDQISGATKTPSALFNSALLTLALTTTAFKLFQKSSESGEDVKKDDKPKSIKSLQLRFLSVFWLIRCADWLQGPYFYEVYSSKVFNGVQASMGIVSKLFLTGFASTALFGPLVGRAADSYGRKKGTLAFCLLYALGAISTKSPMLLVLFLGRLSSGIGTSILFSAPEAWLVGEAQKSGDGAYLGETFGMVCVQKLIFTG